MAHGDPVVSSPSDSLLTGGTKILDSILGEDIDVENEIGSGLWEPPQESRLYPHYSIGLGVGLFGLTGDSEILDLNQGYSGFIQAQIHVLPLLNVFFSVTLARSENEFSQDTESYRLSLDQISVEGGVKFYPFTDGMFKPYLEARYGRTFVTLALGQKNGDTYDELGSISDNGWAFGLGGGVEYAFSGDNIGLQFGFIYRLMEDMEFEDDELEGDFGEDRWDIFLGINFKLG